MNSSSSKQATTNTTKNYQLTDQSYRQISDSYNTYSDQGAIDSSFNFAGDTVNKAITSNADTTKASLDFSNDTVNRSLNTVDYAIKNAIAAPLDLIDSSTKNALDFAKSVVAQQSVTPDTQVTKYVLIGSGLIAAAMVLKK